MSQLLAGEIRTRSCLSEPSSTCVGNSNETSIRSLSLQDDLFNGEFEVNKQSCEDISLTPFTALHTFCDVIPEVITNSTREFFWTGFKVSVTIHGFTGKILLYVDDGNLNLNDNPNLYVENMTKISQTFESDISISTRCVYMDKLGMLHLASCSSEKLKTSALCDVCCSLGAKNMPEHV